MEGSKTKFDITDMLMMMHAANSGKSTSLSEQTAEEHGWLAEPGLPIGQIFPKKRVIHAGMSGDMVPKDEIAKTYAELTSQKRTGPSCAYVHVPYCESKCVYCGFFGGKYTEIAGANYLDCLIWEIEQSANKTSTGKEPIHTLYIGGGTPTALQAHELKRLLQTLRSVLPLSNDCEITVEGRIHNFTDEKMEACLEGGANRFSLGVQSFNTELRQLLGRIAPKEEVIARLKRLASYDQSAVVIDLIYGLPGQTVAMWEDDIKTMLDLPLDGVDLYQLNVFPGSALEKGVQAGKIPATVPLAEQDAYFVAGVKTMEQARARRLSLSHWGLTSRERNFYNPLAKNRADCLNFGTGAGGALHGYFLLNTPGAAEYMAKCKAKELTVSMIGKPPVGFPLVREILSQMEVCRLNMHALDKALALAWPNTELPLAEDLYAPLLHNWEKAGLITRDKEWAELTLAGQFWQVNLSQALLGWSQLFAKEIKE